jgi:hypothetical protein
MVLEGKISWVTNSHLGQWHTLYTKVQLLPKYMGLKSVVLLGTYWETLANLMGTNWELNENRLGTAKTKKNAHPPPPPFASFKTQHTPFSGFLLLKTHYTPKKNLNNK